MLHLSVAGLTYEFDPVLPVGDRVDPASIRIGGQPLVLTDTYRVAANSFLIAGGDSFTAFTTGRPTPTTTAVTGANDVDAFNAYVLANSPVGPPALGRAVSLDPAQPFDDDGSGTGPCAPAGGGTGGPPGGGTGGTPAGPVAPRTTGDSGSPGASGESGDVRVVSATGGRRAGSLAYTGVPVAQILGLGVGCSWWAGS
jgi:hypothetical protein